ncbi:hypothetical protein GCM10010275_61550 [Streptomyces litmocidini]|nr:hypothetical protein GCM10010275_61550 [Streptomyces litmocidini]
MVALEDGGEQFLDLLAHVSGLVPFQLDGASDRSYRHVVLLRLRQCSVQPSQRRGGCAAAPALRDGGGASAPSPTGRLLRGGSRGGAGIAARHGPVLRPVVRPPVRNGPPGPDAPPPGARGGRDARAGEPDAGHRRVAAPGAGRPTRLGA